MGCFETENTPLFVIVRKSEKLPRFDTRFVGYGFNRQQWILHLRYLGYKFVMMRDTFALDVPHPPSPYYLSYKESLTSGKPHNQELFESFVRELHAQFNVSLENKCCFVCCEMVPNKTKMGS